MIEVIAVDEAEKDLLTAWARFEEQRAGLGDRFDAAFAKARDQISKFPESAPYWRRSQFRRLLVKHFDIGVFYAIHGKRAVIRAVLDLRQSEESILRRLTD